MVRHTGHGYAGVVPAEARSDEASIVKNQPRIFVIGSYMHAFVIRAPRIPREGETVFGTDSEIGPGGKGSNQAIAAARLGGKVDILARVGRDSLGEAARELWEQEGLGNRWVSIDEDN